MKMQTRIILACFGVAGVLGIAACSESTPSNTTGYTPDPTGTSTTTATGAATGMTTTTANGGQSSTSTNAQQVQGGDQVAAGGQAADVASTDVTNTDVTSTDVATSTGGGGVVSNETTGGTGAGGAPVTTATEMGGAATGGTSSGGAPAQGQGGLAQGGGDSAAGAGTGGAATTMSAGCTKAAAHDVGTFVDFPLTVPGQPATSMDRTYGVRLPDNYDPTQAYRVVYLGPGCGQQQQYQNNRKGLPFQNGSAATEAILVQLEPGQYNPAQYNPDNCRASTAMSQGDTSGCNENSAYCFDDWAYLNDLPDATAGATMAIERAYFDVLHKTIEDNYCVDTTRQFYSGYSSGGWLAHQLGCWFPDVLRVQSSVTGGLPPPIKSNVEGPNDYCMADPIAAFFIHNNPDPSNAFSGSVDAASRIFNLNGCTGPFNQPPTPNVTAAPEGLEPYEIDGVPNSNNFRCWQYTNCPAEYPMVFCVSSDEGHNDQASRAVPGFWEFFTTF